MTEFDLFFFGLLKTISVCDRKKFKYLQSTHFVEKGNNFF